jgi:hypothetical protein
MTKILIDEAVRLADWHKAMSNEPKRLVVKNILEK